MPNVYVAIDLETTGLDPEHDAIIEIGAVRFRGDQVLATFESLVNPGRPIPFSIQQLTGIKPDDVKHAPPLASVLPRLRRLVGDHPIVGHNVGFDLGFLGRHGLFRDNPAIDTFELASILLPYAGRYNLGMLARALNLSLPATHRALDDARVAHALFIALLDEARRLDLSLIQAVNRMAARSNWSLRPVFADLEQLHARTVFTSSLGQQLAAKGVSGLTRGGRRFLADTPRAQPEPPLRPVATPRPLDVEQLAELLDESGLFSQKMSGFEYRPQQVEMLRQVSQAFNASEHLLIEAGTGTGKSIAYLLPAIYWAVQNGQRVVVATHTINLQDQLLNKDIPELQRILPVEFKAVALKGRSNYVCPQRVRQLQERLSGERATPSPAGEGDVDLQLRVLARVLVWLNTTLTGDRQELFLPTAAENAIWGELCSDPDLCPPERCRRENCFFYRARQAAESAHLVVVNHALLLSDVKAENRVLPDYRYLIIDEAHHLEESVTQQLSFESDQRALDRLLVRLGDAGLPRSTPGGKPGAGKAHAQASLSSELFWGLPEASAAPRHSGLLNRIGLACRDLPAHATAPIQESLAAGHELADQTRRAAYEFFNALDAFMDERAAQSSSQYDRRLRLTRALRRQPAWERIEIAWDNLSVGLGGLSQLLVQLKQELERLDLNYAVQDFEELWSELTSYLNQLEATRAGLKSVMEPAAPQSNQVITWLEQAANTGTVSVHAAPLHVGELVRRHLFDAKEAVILTSATLFTDQGASFLRERLGAHEVAEVSVGSPFDYRNATLLCVPREEDMPPPNDPRYQSTLETALVELVRAVGGRTLVLFTSHNQLRNTARAIQAQLAQDDILVLEQGSGGSRAQLLERFKDTETRSVLLGTRSFWEGIDVAGERLSCVVIVKLPFAVPDDPIFAARSEAYEDSFNQYALPDAILRFRQGFGRLIRTRSDRGVVVCFDSRLLSKAYGDAFLRSLPECTLWRGQLAGLPGLAARWIDEGNLTLEGRYD